MPSLPAALAFLLVLLFAALSLPGVVREGYSPDEELTHLAAAGVAASGLPLLPSGALYGRGLPYSYACAGAGMVFGPSLPIYRFVSLLSVCLAAGALFFLGRAVSGPAWAVFAVAVLILSPWTAMAAQWARFYGMGLFFGLAAALVYARRRERPQELLPFFPLLLALAALCLEPAAALIALPFHDYLSERAPERRARLRPALLLSAAALAVSQALVFFGILATLRTPVSGSDAAWYLADSKILLPRLIVSIFLDRPAAQIAAALFAILLFAGLGRLGAGRVWALLLAVAATLLQPGLIAVFAFFSLLTDPPSWRSRLGATAVALAAATLFWTAVAALTTDASFSPSLGWALLRQGFTYPLAALGNLVAKWPLLCFAASLGALFGGKPTFHARSLAALVLAGALLLEHANAGLQTRYLLIFLPFLALLAAQGFEAALDRCRSQRQRGLIVATAAFLVMLLAGEQSASSGQNSLFKTGSRQIVPMGLGWSSAPLRAWRSLVPEFGSGAIVVCNDAPACALLGIQPTYWLLENPNDVSRFGVPSREGSTDIYTGARIVAGETAFGEVFIRAAGRSVWVVFLETGKYWNTDSAASPPQDRETSGVVSRRITGRGIRITEITAGGTRKINSWLTKGGRTST